MPDHPRNIDPTSELRDGREVLLLREPEIRALVDEAQALDAVREAFVALARGTVEQPDPLSLDLREQHGEVHVKGGYLHGARFYSIKVASGFYDNPARGLPVADGGSWVFDATTGRPVANLLDNGFLTDLRTGAAGALAAELLSPERIATATIVGAGGQAGYQLRALLGVRSPARVLLWARRPEAARARAAELTERCGVTVEAVDALQDAVAESQLVVTATPSRAPLIEDAWVRPGTHLTAVGSDMPGKVELDPALLARATVVADRLAQCARYGEIAAAVAAGAIALDDVHAELGEVADDPRRGRVDAEEITVADLTGVGALDAAVAGLVTETALEHGVGERLRL